MVCYDLPDELNRFKTPGVYWRSGSGSEKQPLEAHRPPVEPRMRPWGKKILHVGPPRTENTVGVYDSFQEPAHIRLRRDP